MPMETIKQPQSNKNSTGYPEIEKLIDTEDFNDVNQKFKEAYNNLEYIYRHKRGLKKSREAKKGMKAIELIMDLFRELLTIKYRMQEIIASKQKNPK